MQAVQTPIIPTVAALIRDNPGTISLGQGVAYYGPPQEAIDNIGAFLADPENHKYKPVQGIPQLVEAFGAKLRSENGIEVEGRSTVVVTAGANMAFVNALLAITDLGDEIIIQTPYYFNHEMAITMAGCRPVPVDTDEHYQLQPDAIRRAITPRTRAVVTISPNNPSGAVYGEALLREVNGICREQRYLPHQRRGLRVLHLRRRPPFFPGIHRGELRSHHLAVLALQSLWVRQLAHRLHGHPGGSVRAGAEDPGHHPHLRPGDLAVRCSGSAERRAGLLPLQVSER